MVQTRTTDCGNSLRRHWLHGEQTNSKTGTAQRYPNGILNHSQRYTDGKPGWCPKHQPGNPRQRCYPCQGTAKAVSLLERVTRLARAAQRPDTHAGTERPHRGLSSADADALFEPLPTMQKRDTAKGEHA